MGKKVTVTLFDDLEPELDADEHLPFAFDGISYEIDLSKKNANRFRKEMETWTKVATRAGSTRAKRSTAVKNTYSAGERGLPLSEIRKWAVANGHRCGNRGRVSAEIVRLWKADNGTTNSATAEQPEFSASGS